MLARANPELDDLSNEIYRCQRIAELHRNEPDQEVKDYCTDQLDRAAKLATQLQSKIKQTVQAGSFVFRGQATAVSALDAACWRQPRSSSPMWLTRCSTLCRSAGTRWHRHR